MENRPLSGRAALVTGAGSGMGRAIALALAEAGAGVVGVSRSGERLAETEGTIQAAGGRACVLPADVSDPATAERAVSLCVEQFGRLDILVNCAGDNVAARLLGEISVEDWRRLVDVNLNALFYFVRSALPQLRTNGGTVVNVLSFGAREPAPWSGAAYAAAKSGGLALTRLLNVEERRRGVRACALLPGDTDTPLMDRRPIPPSAAERGAMLRPADVAAAVMYAVTAPPHVNVEEVAIRPVRMRDTAAEFRRSLESAP